MKTNISFPVILFLLSFICALSPVGTLQVEFFGLSVVLLFAWSYALLSRNVENGWALPKSPVLLLAGLFWLLVIASTFWAQVKPVSLMAVCFFSVLPLTFFTGVLRTDHDYFKKTALSLAAIFAVLSVWAVVQFFFMGEYFSGHAQHPLNDSALLGALFCMGFLCALGWVLSGTAGKSHAMAVTLSVLLLLGILSTATPEPLYALVPGFLFLAVFLRNSVWTCKKSILLIVLCGLAFFGATTLHKPAVEPIMPGGRMAIWSSTAAMIKDAPVTGVGIGNFSLHYPQYRSAADEGGGYLAKNDPLQFWAELGIFGPLLFYAFIIACAVRTFSALKKSDPVQRIVIASLFSGFVSMVAQSHISPVHYTLSILMLAGFMLSVWFVITGQAKGEIIQSKPVAQKLVPVMKFALLLPFLIVGWLLVSLVGGEHLVNKANAELAREDMNGFARDINMADKIAQGMNYRVYLAAVNVPLAILIDKKKYLNTEAQKNLYNQVAGYMDDVIATNPREPSAYFYLAKIQGMVSNEAIPENAQKPDELYKKALALDPATVDARLGLYNFYKDQKKSNDELLAVMEPGVEYYYKTPTADTYYMELSKLYLESGHMDKVEETMQRGLSFKKRFLDKKDQKPPSSEPVTGSMSRPGKH